MWDARLWSCLAPCLAAGPIYNPSHLKPSFTDDQARVYNKMDQQSVMLRRMIAALRVQHKMGHNHTAAIQQAEAWLHKLHFAKQQIVLATQPLELQEFFAYAPSVYAPRVPTQVRCCIVPAYV